MRSKRLFCPLLLIVTAHLPLFAPAQRREADDDVRNAFLITRGDAYLVSQQKAPPGNGGKPAAGARTNRRPQAANAGGAPGRSRSPIGLGYTLFKKTVDGKPVRVNPSQVFREGDGVRFMIESNTNGYLYIFHRENDGLPRMIFPDARLQGGDNRIKAHVPYETPSGGEPGDWWFFFDGQAATERFYLMVARAPLPGVMIGERLVAHYQVNPEAHPWQPSEATWKWLLAKAAVAARVSQDRESGETQTEAERDAVKRGIELRPGAPAPSVIKVSASSNARMLVAQISLVHK